ncbi:cyclase family protein [Noviherbaspirillum sp. CPCC 100848]|uniref:Cyclase family protein n=1 Tax=Noviherbaspirillum album TaxID=3080276 RepID=A0ABU6JD03_9BURK|nr:cyclase family protein [Noviherbaspirillum sp. CPCC 100848]MEC4721326.1 cyclase family protein [Noviherbaspirillum sp. CPCC 100848]
MLNSPIPLSKFFAGSLIAASMLALPAHAEQSCFPSKFGPDDQIGNLNYVTPEKTLRASKLIKTGKSYRLGIETNKNTPAFAPRTFELSVVQPGQENGPLGPSKTSYNDDIINGWVGIGSQLDGLGHIGIDDVYYNCNKASDFVRKDGLRKLGIEQVPAIATRAILLDMTSYFGMNPVKEGTPFNKAEIDGAMQKQGIKSIEKGDVVLFYTGWAKLIGKDDARYSAGEPGLGIEGARYLASLGVAMVGSDSWAVEVLPAEPNAGTFEVHQILLPMNGIHILENMNTEEMVKDQAWESFFTLGPSRITGAVQAIINPIAIR